MARAQAGDTRARIQDTAVALFRTQGFEKTSLREIADQLGFTKAALYYHFPSKSDLIRSLVQPAIDDADAFFRDAEAAGDIPPRQLLESYFAMMYRHRGIYLVVSRDLSAFAHLGLETKSVEWRERLQRLLVGADATPAQFARATVAIGGLADCAIVFPDLPADQLRVVAVDAAYAALGC